MLTLVVCHASLRHKVVMRRCIQDFGVSNVGSVQVAQEVYGGGEGYDALVLLPQQSLLRLGRYGRVVCCVGLYKRERESRVS